MFDSYYDLPNKTGTSQLEKQISATLVNCSRDSQKVPMRMDAVDPFSSKSSSTFNKAHKANDLANDLAD